METKLWKLLLIVLLMEMNNICIKLLVQVQRMVSHSYKDIYIMKSQAFTKSGAMVSRSGGWKNRRCVYVFRHSAL